MLRRPERRRRDLLLDLVFLVWLSYVMVAGRILPDEVVSFLRNDPPAAAITEPIDLPELSPGPTLEMDSLVPEA